jgi:hypothetical protein
VCTREQRCGTFGAGGCSRLEHSGGVKQYIADRVYVLVSEQEAAAGRGRVEECPWMHERV